MKVFLDFVNDFGLEVAVKLFANNCFAKRANNEGIMESFVKFVFEFGITNATTLFQRGFVQFIDNDAFVKSYSSIVEQTNDKIAKTIYSRRCFAEGLARSPSIFQIVCDWTCDIGMACMLFRRDGMAKQIFLSEDHCNDMLRRCGELSDCLASNISASVLRVYVETQNFKEMGWGQRNSVWNVQSLAKFHAVSMFSSDAFYNAVFGPTTCGTVEMLKRVFNKIQITKSLTDKKQVDSLNFFRATDSIWQSLDEHGNVSNDKKERKGQYRAFYFTTNKYTTAATSFLPDTMQYLVESTQVGVNGDRQRWGYFYLKNKITEDGACARYLEKGSIITVCKEAGPEATRKITSGKDRSNITSHGIMPKAKNQYT